VSSLDITPTIFSGVPTLITWNSAIVALRPRKALPSEPPVPCYKVQQVAIHWATPGTALRTDKQDRRQKRVRQETKPEAT
jgi:hypothetical protein